MTLTVNQRAARTETPGAGDRELLERLLAGDEAAFETLVGMLHRPMLRFVRTSSREPTSPRRSCRRRG
jgi:hypothetical protein